jgi:hypothetical protein
MLKRPALPPPAVIRIHRFMVRIFPAVAAAVATCLLPACGEKSEAEKAEDERALIREERRKQAIQVYQTLAKEYPDDPHAAEAKQRAAALQGPKK